MGVVTEATHPTRTYVVREDPDVRRRLIRAATLRNWKSWIWHGVKWGAKLALVVFFTLLVVGSATGSRYPMVEGMVPAFVIGFVWVMVGFLDGLRSRSEASQVWTCELTDEYWSYQTTNGLRAEIPWKLMRLQMSHPDGWLIDYADSSVWVYRGPLRDAGLEDEFLNRIPARPE